MAIKAGSSDFLNNLGRVYGIYTGGFLAFIILIAVLEQMGVPNRILGYLFVFFTISVYAIIGVLSRTAQVSEYYVAGRSVPAFYNGMATGADWMSAASFVGMAGTLFLLGYDGIAWVLGWTGGFVLVSILIGPYLRKFGAYTVPDFLAFRYGGNFARGLGVIVLVACSFTYVTAQIYGTGIIASRFLGMPFEIAVFAGLVGILVCSMLGGMRAVTWTQVAQYIVLIIAYLTPIVILSTKKFGIPIPELTYGQAIADITAREQQMLATGLATVANLKPHIAPFINYSPLNFFAIIMCMMVGTASLPHILMRYFTTPSVREARQSVAWSLLFIFLLYFSAPAYAAFSKLEVYTNIIGANVSALKPWIFNWGELGLIQICGKNAGSIDAIVAACKAIAGHPGVVRLQDFVINTDVIVLSTPEIAGLPYVISGLVAAGGLAAALSTADGLLLAIANALSHDVYYKMIDPNAPTVRRLMIARVLLLIVAVVAASLAATKPGDILAMVGWAFSLAMAGNFPALVMGVWWKRATATGAVCGIIAGFGLCLFYLVTTRYFPGAGVKYFGMTSLLNPVTGAPLVDIAKAMALPNAMEHWPTLAHPLANKVGWFDLTNIACGLLGAPLGFAVIYIVSKLGKEPSREMMAYVDDIRKPRGRTVLEEKTT
jgi:cation/acetate symporter